MKKFIILTISISIFIGTAMYICQKNHKTITPAPAKTELITPKPTAKPTPNTTKYEEKIYIGNRHSKKFHSPDCYTLPTEKNRVIFSSRQRAIDFGYTPCGNCNP